MRKQQEELYRFHKELNRPFSGPEELLSRGLRCIAELLRVDRISLFDYRPESRELARRCCLNRDLWLEMGEEIYLPEGSDLHKLAVGRAAYVGFVKPHPILYLPLCWPPGKESETLGILRLERTGGKQALSAAERDFALGLAAELAQNLQMEQATNVRKRQLKRMETLTDLTAIFATSLRVEDGLKLILQGIAQHFQLDRVRLYLVEHGREVLRGELSVDIRGRVVGLRSVEIPLASSEHRFAKILRGEGLDEHMKRYQERVVYLPLTVQGEKKGLLIVDNLISQQAIEGQDIGLLKSFAGQIALAVDNARLFDEVQALSLYDSLTNLPVRRFFDQRFQEELYRVERSTQPLSVAMIDIDYFKSVNDTFGHQIGDQVLKEIGRIILKNLRKIDFPSRYGGDEVLILLPQANEDEALAIMTRLSQSLKEIRIPVPFSRQKELSVTVSVGLASFPADGRSQKQLLQKADEALYWVKSRGRDGVSTYRQAVAESPSLVDRE
ncbi:MAG: sensor domain-containing diguanylate cyclase [Elusimicrobiota bacterium]